MTLGICRFPATAGWVDKRCLTTHVSQEVVFKLHTQGLGVSGVHACKGNPATSPNVSPDSVALGVFKQVWAC